MKNLALIDVAEIASGQAAPKETEMGKIGFPFIRAGHLSELISSNNIDSLPKVNSNIAKLKKLKLIPPNTILFAKSGMSATLNKIYRLQKEAYYVSHLAAIIPSYKVEPIYLQYFLRWYKPSKLILDSAYPSIKLSDIGKIQIPLPTLPVQKSISEILDKAEALCRKNKQLIAIYDELLQATFLDMFGDPAKNLKGFRNIEFNEIISQGPTNGIYKPQSEYGEGNFILRIDTYNNGDLTYIDNLKRVKATVKEMETYSLKKLDILINRVNSPSHLGKSTLVIGISEDAIFESNMMRIRIDHVFANPFFIIKVLSQPYLKGQILTRAKDAVNQSSINQADVKGFTFYLPPISLQNQFAEIVENIEAQKAIAKLSLQESEDLFNGLVQKVFSDGLQ